MSEEIVKEEYELIDKDGNIIAEGLTYDEYKAMMLEKYGVDIEEGK